MQGSWRPVICRSASVPVDRRTVCCFRAMEGVGLKAVRNRMGMPLEMPPKMPPAWLVRVRMAPSSITKGSLCSEPRMRAASKPEPNSTPFTAGMANRAAENWLSSPWNMGFPSPAGAPWAMHSTTPPTESPASRAWRMAARMRSPARSSSTGKGARFTPSSTSRGSPRGWKGRSSTLAMERMWAPIWMPRRDRIWRATPPAMHRGAVRRPEKWPPPRTSWQPPYFTWAVKSAWAGRGLSRSSS